MSKYQVVIDKGEGGAIIFPAYDSWNLAAVTADELARIVNGTVSVWFVANSEAVQAGAGAEYSEYLNACKALAYGEVK